MDATEEQANLSTPPQPPMEIDRSERVLNEAIELAEVPDNAYTREWKKVDEQLQQQEVATFAVQVAIDRLQSSLADKEREEDLDVGTPTLRLLENRAAALRRHAVGLTQRHMLLIALSGADPDEVLLLGGKFPLADIIEMAHVAGQDRLKEVVDIAKEKLEHCDRLFAKYTKRPAPGDYEALQELRHAALASLVESERIALHVFAEVEPWLASVVNPILKKRVEAPAVPTKLLTRGD